MGAVAVIATLRYRSAMPLAGSWSTATADAIKATWSALSGIAACGQRSARARRTRPRTNYEIRDDELRKLRKLRNLRNGAQRSIHGGGLFLPLEHL